MAHLRDNLTFRMIKLNMRVFLSLIVARFYYTAKISIFLLLKLILLYFEGEGQLNVE
jgi:hypothetical protein